MELIVLGSGTGVPHPRRGAAGYVVRAGSEVLLFDCGPGTMVRMLRAGIDYRDLHHVFISHHHPDHCADLIALIFANNWGFHRKTTLRIHGPRGTANLLSRLYEIFPGLEPERYQPHVEDWESGTVRGRGWEVEAAPVVHGKVAALGHRIRADDRVLVYSGDTGECPHIVGLARDADLLLVECSYPDQVQGLTSHLTPSAAGRVATQAGARRVVLTHFYPECETVDVRAQCAKQYRGPIRLARDGLRITV